MKKLNLKSTDTEGQTPDKVNILLVDDNTSNLQALEETLSSLGENLVSVTSGKEALKKLMAEEFAVILLDVNMPEMDGYETATLIRGHAKTRSLPIMFVTAYDKGEPFILEGYSIGAVDYILKPYNLEILKSKVRVYVELFRTKEELRAAKQLSEERLQNHNQLLIHELQHRVKNTLATVMSVISLSKPADNDIEKYISSLEDRLLSMSNTHSLVNRSDGKPIDIKTIIEKEFRAYDGAEVELYDLKGPSLFIIPAHVRIISMAIHELVTNACKHGALSMPNRKVILTTSLKDGIANLKWEEKGDLKGLPQGQPKGGFGSFLLSKIVAAELQGAATYEITPGGLLFNLEFPLKEAVS